MQEPSIGVIQNEKWKTGKGVSFGDGETDDAPRRKHAGECLRWIDSEAC